MCSDRAPPPPPESSVIEPDNFSDNDSTYPGSLGDASYTTSITSSAMNYATVADTIPTTRENTSWYAHSIIHVASPLLISQPNDEQEQDRLDLSHHIYRMLFKGELNRAPIKNPARVLDIGTGTGIWAIDYADEHPEAEVIGNDLSPIQPSWIPPNCRFEVDDFEQPWSYSKPFDYIHGRELEGCVRDIDNLYRQALENLKPGGWMEMASMEVNTYSDDDTHLRAKNLLEGIVYMHDCAREYGKDMTSVHSWKEKMEKAGFVNVREEIFKLPQSPWPKDPKMKDLGRYHQVNMFEALGPYCYALFTRVMGWERTEIEVFVAGMKQELRDLNNHLYTKVHIVYGQRPE
ncbi:methyltransferase [Aspergillus piperis CBS 112811]|uniref:Methyltransferase n=1 Tax=Aspergillus piperis CBS 112811 TaxID=1448313 RepID=A0A8G1R9E0_9EURO|nr:methyltransferase [Aspergillus piperis CBS 112811]RAH61698.1 methyltransferase [Aspergillus piperis CBS 112811]